MRTARKWYHGSTATGPRGVVSVGEGLFSGSWEAPVFLRISLTLYMQAA